jgi:DNA-binding MarR family transcriptional regulator
VDPDGVTEVAQHLRVAVGRVARRLRRLSAEGDDLGATKFNELLVLARLDHEGPLSPSDLATYERVTSQAITAIVRGLESDGLVARQAHSTDGRRTVLSITAAGRAAFCGPEQAALRTTVDRLRTEFTADEVRQIAAAIPRLERLAEAL